MTITPRHSSLAGLKAFWSGFTLVMVVIGLRQLPDANTVSIHHPTAEVGADQHCRHEDAR